MEITEFEKLVLHGDEQEALAALEQNPAFASARSAEGVSLLCLAVYRRSNQLVSAMTAQRSALDLFEATCVGDDERVAALIDAAPTSLNAISPDGFSAVGYAAFFGHARVLQALIARGAKVNIPSQNAMQVRPIHSAAAHSDQERAVSLAHQVLDAGAEPNAKQQGGFTALHEAARNGNLALIELVLKYGGDAKIENDQGLTPIDLARANGHPAAAELLEQGAMDTQMRFS